MGLLDGKIALVTGGSSGIGRETALAFARQGARVVVASRHDTAGEETVQRVREAGGEALFVRTDVTCETDMKTAVESAVEAFGKLDLAFNNAGVEQHAQPLPEQDETTFDRIMAVNAKGVWLALKHEIPTMLRTAGGGAIVNTSSIAGVIAFPQVPIYTAAKHAVVGLTKAVALEYATRNVRVNAVNPGAVDTEMFARFAGDNASLRQQVMALHPMGRLARSEEIAHAVVWLCSDLSSFVTGHTLMIDGGYVAA
jgi:NAD(P)-dependent dehydrogenase (short-subunit alcohol dehydrogenase family)